jgi:pimeloyl-ACP methyl ester carboxylesterase
MIECTDLSRRGERSEQLAFDLGSISSFSKPVLFTLGDQSPPTFAPVVTRLSRAVPHAEIVTLRGAGHVPHATHPDTYVEAIISSRISIPHNTRQHPPRFARG